MWRGDRNLGLNSWFLCSILDLFNLGTMGHFSLINRSAYVLLIELKRPSFLALHYSLSCSFASSLL